jgi:uncharacterized protein YkwD
VKGQVVWVSGLLSLWAAACTLQPLTQAPPATVTLPPARVVVLTFTPPPAPPATETPVPAATLAPTDAPSMTPVLVSHQGGPERPAVAAPPAASGASVPAPGPAVEPGPLPGEAPTQAPVEAPTQPPLAPAEGDTAAAEQYTIDLINSQRAAAGQLPLARDETLMSIARARVADMIDRGYTGHNDPLTGAPLARQMMRAAGYTSVYLGENWYGSIKPPPALVEVAMGWFITDPSHASNILSPNYAAVGVGIGYTGRQWLLIQNFAGAN